MMIHDFHLSSLHRFLLWIRQILSSKGVQFMLGKWHRKIRAIRQMLQERSTEISGQFPSTDNLEMLKDKDLQLDGLNPEKGRTRGTQSSIWVGKLFLRDTDE
ncbi:unnamed protein product [Fraxinus pennsylvanica]|uniref:Uncharacterized protein n=1 Tax=Fraxinus pennsylvanica TaxID=56036 RepID=A0AAD1ZG15_9LAMI|nr:unnamed protein product [Fraxinus pennsylvanica]